MKKMECPIDKRVVFQVPPELENYDGHCITTKTNSSCPFIGWGCIGCRFDKEMLLKSFEETERKICEIGKQMALKVKTQSPEIQRRFEISQRVINSAMGLAKAFSAAADSVRGLNIVLKKNCRKRKPIRRLK